MDYILSIVKAPEDSWYTSKHFRAGDGVISVGKCF